MRGKSNLEESLAFSVQSELMEGDNQYLCEEAGKKVTPSRLSGHLTTSGDFSMPCLYAMHMYAS